MATAPVADAGQQGFCVGQRATIVGNNRDNVIRGTNGADVITAGAAATGSSGVAAPTSSVGRWRAWPKLKARRNVPSVEGAATR